ncbi:hypothetical protein [Ochrobactrum sp. Marseille-Q0166]|uniref:hypothetical protein n=1 Tax=Ochrobactrum sp. Marseille-Q0166 TaxID=2761105 RepID=UPI0016559965|nr:hypothetical protein [Ochrobactrum sp. Marseille-Q0166]MBC8718904.1 hypothetical protein [Ochrobactrum sp. Marseille-Q0166]
MPLNRISDSTISIAKQFDFKKENLEIERKNKKNYVFITNSQDINNKLNLINKNSNSSNLIARYGREAHTSMINFINSSSEKRLNEITRSEYNKNDLIDYLSRKAKKGNEHSDMFKKVLQLFDLKAHSLKSAPNREHDKDGIQIKTNLLTSATGAISTAAGFVVRSGLEAIGCNSTLAITGGTVAGGAANNLSKMAIDCWSGNKDHVNSLANDKNSEIYERIQSLAKTVWKGSNC